MRPLRLEEALFDAILAASRAQQAARHLAESTKREREAIVRRFRAEVERWPWEWRALAVDEWLQAARLPDGEDNPSPDSPALPSTTSTTAPARSACASGPSRSSCPSR